MKNYDIVIIGGGPAGLAAAVSAKRNGTDSILILERDKELGGILNQCIHNGFGLHTFQEELTGPEYAQRFIDQVVELGIEYRLNTMDMDISHEKVVTAMNKEEGLFEIQAKAVILSMGCRERSRGALNIPGYRPAGIYSAGTAQRLVNMEGMMPGREIVILGSGDIGLIMARRMTLEGAKVKSGSGADAVFRRTEEEYCSMSRRLWNSAEIKSYSCRHQGKGTAGRSHTGRSGSKRETNSWNGRRVFM